VVAAALGRPAVEVGADGLAAYAAGAVVLVTGAGGSVGVELCSRLARLGAAALVLVDQAEAPLADVATALAHDHGFTATASVLADIRNRARVHEVFRRHRPDVVFHTAAYKQVPLLEEHPVEAAATNVVATRHVVDAARRSGAERFVLFSTDKAVEPASVLGRTKAVAEWIVAAAGGRYASIRLGNVVDSAGSMLPLFQAQAARGGPVTITHPEMTRYLMTAGEAAGLALAAGGLAGANDVFWLDTGPPVRIVDVAWRVARASRPPVAVEVVGLRAGERLHELQCSRGDAVAATPCERVLRSTVRPVGRAWLDAALATLERQVAVASEPGVRALLAEMCGAPAYEAVDTLSSAAATG